MRRLVAAALMLSIVLAGFAVSAPAASACDIAETFRVTPDQLAAGDFNDPDSQLARAYREWYGDDDATIQVFGVYVYETIYTVEPDGDWSRGSVSVPVELWGQWPSDRSPRAISPEDQSGEPPDNCGWDSGGRPLGTRDYRLVTEANLVDLDVRGGEPDAVLTAAFGSPDVAQRNSDLEQELIAQISASRNSRTGLFVAAGVVAIAAAAGVLYLTRRTSDAVPDGEAAAF